MGQPQAGQVAVALGKPRQPIDDGHHADADKIEGLAEEDQIGIVGDITTGRSPVDDRPRGGTGIAVGVDMSHHVVAQATFVLPRGLKIDLVRLALHLGQLLVGDRQPQFLFRFGQGDPQPPPRPKFPLVPPQTAHFLRRVTADQRVVV